MAEELYRAASPLLTQEADSRRYRLVGVGVAELVSAAQADLPDLLDPARDKRVKIERAIDQVRAKLGDAAIGKGRALGTAQRPERAGDKPQPKKARSEEHTSELQSLMRTSYAVFCLKKN